MYGVFLLNLTSVSESSKVTQKKTTKYSLIRVQQLNYSNNTDQERF